jgi:hypothetical protein
MPSWHDRGRGPHGWRIGMQDVTLLAPVVGGWSAASTAPRRSDHRETDIIMHGHQGISPLHWRRSRRHVLRLQLFRSTPGETYCASNHKDFIDPRQNHSHCDTPWQKPSANGQNKPPQDRDNLPNGCHIPIDGYRQMHRTNVEGCHSR